MKDIKKTLKLAVCSGLGNAEKLIKRVNNGEHFDFIEVMACPGGCINGGGQPFTMREGIIKRTKGLYASDKLHSVRTAEENPLLETLYSGVLKGKTHELLHVHYKQKNK